MASEHDAFSDLPDRSRAFRQIRELIERGQLRPGDLIPSERKLAEQLKVGRGVIRGVLSGLRREGLIREGVSRGWLVAERDRQAGTPTPETLLKSTVVVITPAPHIQAGHRQPGWAEYIAQGAIHAVRTGRHDVFVVNPYRLEEDSVQKLIDAQPLGVLVPEVPDAADAIPLRALTQLRAQGVPVVVYGRDPSLDGFDRVFSDHEEGCAMLTRWALSQGRRRIVCYWGKGMTATYWGRQRRAGYERAMREAGLEPLPVLEHFSWNEALGSGRSEAEVFEAFVRMHAGYLLTGKLGSAGWKHGVPDALLLMTDGICAEIIAACRFIGLEPGKDVLVCGYDNYFAENRFREFEASVPSATVDKRNAVAGRVMFELLTDRISGKLTSEPQERPVAPELILTEQ